MTSAASVPGTAKGTGQFDSVQGSFFSSESAPEAILHMDLAKQMADEAKIQPADLIGQEVVLRYPQRKPVSRGAKSVCRRPSCKRRIWHGFHDRARRNESEDRRIGAKTSKPVRAGSAACASCCHCNLWSN